MAFNRAGTLLASSCNNRLVCLWSVESGTLLATLPQQDRAIDGLAFHPDGRMLAVANWRVTSFWDIAQLSQHNATQPDQRAHAYATLTAPIDILGGKDGAHRDVTFSTSGELLACAGVDAIISLWHVESRQCLHLLEGHTGMATRVAFSPDDRILVSGGSDQTVRVWDVSTGKCLDVLHGHANSVTTIAMSGDGQTLASGGEDGLIRLWELQGSGQRRVIRTFQGSLDWMRRLSFSSEGIVADGVLLAAGGGKGWCYIWHVALAGDKERPSSSYRCTLKGHTGAIRVTAFRPQTAQVATAGDDCTVRIWDALSGECLQVLHDHTDRLMFMTFDAQGARFASGAQDGLVHLWTIDGSGHYQRQQTIQANQIRLASLALSADGKTVATNGPDHKVRLWDWETGACRQLFDLPNAHARAMDFSPNGKQLIVAQTNGQIHIFDLSAPTAPRLRHFQHHQSPINTVAFNPAGDLAVTGASDPTLYVWDVMTGQERHALGGFEQGVMGLAFWPNRNLFAATGRDGMIRLIDADTGNVLTTFKPPGPYEGMNISGVTGISEAQRAALQALGV
ncbi:MAG: PQQ-binding-like beta-propeller repeat protein, partial [Caldilineaceae bacterium]|nr:PQQ-binding-like beta-propeller repeat protein [Caldilineaceae bacterium]